MATAKQSNFDPIDAIREGGFRLQFIYYIAILVFVVLIGRLWFLQVMSGEIFAERAEANHIRILPIPAPRGFILDRKGRPLVINRTSYNLVLSRKDVNDNDLDEITKVLVHDLKIDPDWLEKRFETARYEAKHESIVIKEGATHADAAWVESHQLEYPMIRL